MEEFVKRLQLAAELSGEGGDGVEELPGDAAAVAAKCSSWGVEAQLKLYQAEGVAWLIRRYNRGVNVILGGIVYYNVITEIPSNNFGMQMGLGKTLQSIALLAYLMSQQQCAGPFLILSPLSVTDGWASELARFAPQLSVLRYVGNKEAREGFCKSICNHVNKQAPQSRADPVLPFDVLLTTYELAVVDAMFLSRFCWRYTIVDEAQRLKNPSTVLYQTLQEQYMIPRRLLLTGTPVQNNLSELWSLLHFCMPKIFDNLSNFLNAFGPAAVSIQDKAVEIKSDGDHGAESSNERLDLLRRILGAFMLRRTKAALVQTQALSLPPMVEVTVFAPLVPLQKKVYLSLLKKELPKITGVDTSSASKQSLQNIVIHLRKACSHPYLFDGIEPEPFSEGEHLVQASGKLIILDLMLDRLRAKGHRVLLFAQMTRTLDIIQDYLQFRGYTYERLDGSVRAEERFAAVRSFSTTVGDSNDSFVFLLTTRAGGVGLNLVAADTVIFYEQDWNPQADKQALQRAHRIGQLHSVLVLNLVTEGTIEEVILQRARIKLQLTNNVIGRDDAALEEHGHAGVDKSDLRSMIVFGLHKMVSQPVSSTEKAGTPPADNTDVATKMVSIVNSALDQRAKIDTEVLNSDYGNKSSLSVLEDPSLESAREGARYLNDLLREPEDNVDVDLVALKSLETSTTAGTDDSNGESGSRRGRKQAIFVDNGEAEARKKQKKDERKQSMWNAHGYVSLCVSEPDTEVNENDQMTGEDTEYIHHLVGDCAKPKLASGGRGIIFWCVDDSGTWGRGGVFSSLEQLSVKIPEAYKAAHDFGDLHLGDLHLIPVPGTESTESASFNQKDEREGHLWAALAVVQSCDHRRKVVRSDISFPDLEHCIKKLAASACACAASVHMPRIQAGSGWYMVERLLRKYAARYQTHFNVYYFRRNVGQHCTGS